MPETKTIEVKRIKLKIEFDLTDDKVHELAQHFNFSSETPMPRLREIVAGELQRRMIEYAANITDRETCDHCYKEATRRVCRQHDFYGG